MGESAWIAPGAWEAREAVAPARCNELIRGFFGAATFCGGWKGHDGRCSPAMSPLEESG